VGRDIPPLHGKRHAVPDGEGMSYPRGGSYPHIWGTLYTFYAISDCGTSVLVNSALNLFAHQQSLDPPRTGLTAGEAAFLRTGSESPPTL